MWNKTSKTLALSAALLLTAPMSMAQDSNKVSEDDLATYAEARNELAEVSQSYRSKMKEAENKQEAQKMRKQMQEEMTGTIEEVGLSVKEYNQITKALRDDKELRERLRSMQSDGESGGSS